MCELSCDDNLKFYGSRSRAVRSDALEGEGKMKRYRQVLLSVLDLVGSPLLLVVIIFVLIVLIASMIM